MDALLTDVGYKVRSATEDVAGYKLTFYDPYTRDYARINLWDAGYHVAPKNPAHDYTLYVYKVCPGDNCPCHILSD